MGTALIRNRANKHFAKNPLLLRKRNLFPIEKTVTTDLKEGIITPICVKEVVPGQTIKLNLTSLLRMAPTISPTMDNLIFKTYAFFVPYRQCWKHFVNFMGEKMYPENPEREIEYTMPVINSGKNGFESLSLADHFGIPTKVPNLDVSRLPFDAHNRIYNFYFRNQRLENMKYQEDDDTDGDITNYGLYRISKARDYFTSCLPDTQDGEPIKLPIGTEAEVKSRFNTIKLRTDTQDSDRYLQFMDNSGPSGGRWTLSAEHDSSTNADADWKNVQLNNNTKPANTSWMRPTQFPAIKDGQLWADLTNALGTNIIALREAIALQEYQELNNRGGNRYFEQLANRFGTINPDLVLQNPEYLGGTQKMINIMPVTQTSATENQDTPAGNLTGYGICGDGGNIINKSFGEWGCIIIYGVVTTYKKYQQGLHKMWTRFDKLDYLAPEFVLVGDQAVLNKEIYAQGKDVTDEAGNIIDDLPFGYQERFGEYKYDLNEIHGQQRSNYEYSLDYNHLAEYYSELPMLNKDFDKENAPIERILQWQGNTEVDKNKRLEFFVDIALTGENLIQLPINTIPAISSRFSNIT